MKLALKYAIFALIATGANILAQDVALQLYAGAYHLALSVLGGTGVGLLVKYELDKRFIFNFRALNTVDDGKTFLLYTLVGIVTTAVFWGFEFGFDYLFGSKAMRYIGGVIGLALGYVLKYQLDKRFVFRVVLS